MRSLKGVFFVVVIVSLLAGCQQYDPKADMEALDAVLESLSAGINEGDAAKVTALFAKNPEPVVYGIHEELSGYAAIQAAWEKNLGDGVAKTFTITDKHVKLDRGLATSYGLWTLEMPGPEGAITMSGRFTIVLGKREGTWEILMMHTSRVLPMPAPIEAPAEPEA